MTGHQMQMQPSGIGLTPEMTTSAPTLSKTAVPNISAAVCTSVPPTVVYGSNGAAAVGGEGLEALPETTVGSSGKVTPAYSSTSVDPTVKDESAAEDEPPRKRGRGLGTLG